MVTTAQKRLRSLTASVAYAHAARKVEYKKYIDIKEVICFNKVPARFILIDGYIFPDVPSMYGGNIDIGWSVKDMVSNSQRQPFNSCRLPSKNVSSLVVLKVSHRVGGA